MSRLIYVIKVKLVKLKMEYYSFRILSVIPMVTTKNIVIEYTEKEKKKGIKMAYYKK